MARKKLEKPTKSMRDAALRALHAAVVDPGSPLYAKVSAAKTLLRGERDEAGDDPQEDRGPPSVVEIPDDGRNPGLVCLGIERTPAAYWITYDGKSEAGLADLARWRLEVAAEIAAAFPPAAEVVAAPAKLTEAEQKRRWRAKVKARQAASAASA